MFALLAGIFVLLQGPAAPAQDEASLVQAYYELWMNSLKETDYNKTLRLAGQHAKTRRTLIRQLIHTAKQPSQPIKVVDGNPVYAWHEPKHQALLLLAEFPDREAIPVLLANLGYENIKNPTETNTFRLGHYFPAADALVKVGVPAMPEVVMKLSLEPKDGRMRHNLCWILEQHYSRKWAKVRIDEEIAKPTLSPWQRSYLKAAQDQYFADAKPIPPYRQYVGGP